MKAVVQGQRPYRMDESFLVVTGRVAIGQNWHPTWSCRGPARSRRSTAMLPVWEGHNSDWPFWGVAGNAFVFAFFPLQFTVLMLSCVCVCGGGRNHDTLSCLWLLQRQCLRLWCFAATKWVRCLAWLDLHVLWFQRGFELVQSLVPALQQTSVNAKQSKASMLTKSKLVFVPSIEVFL